MRPGYFPANLIFALLLVAACVFFLVSVSRLYRILRLARPEHRSDRIGQRFLAVITFVLGQRRVVREPAGWGHFFIFWGFVVIVPGSLETFGKGLHHTFAYWKLLGKPAVALLYLLEDLLAVAVVAALFVALYRRFVLRPERLAYEDQGAADLDAGIIIALILVLIGLLFGARATEYLLVRGKPGLFFPRAAFVSVAFSRVFAGLGRQALGNWWSFFWWGHTVVILAFLVYIPYSKHLHLLAAAPNIFFQSFRPLGYLDWMELEESAESYGVSKVEEFSWKQLLDLYACTECGRCSENCPAWLTDKPLSPKLTIHRLKKHLQRKGRGVLAAGACAGRAGAANPGSEPARVLVGDICQEDEIWSCTTCGSCMEHCPVFVEHINKYVDMRRYLVLTRSRFPAEAASVFRNWETNSNPWGLGFAGRGEWAAEQPVKTLAEDAGVEYLFYVGCAGSFDQRGKKISLALVRLLNRAGVSFGILGAEERCCGETARRMGNEYLFQLMAAELAEIINGYGVKKIITACPHGYNCLKNEYPQVGGNWEVYHHSEILAGLLEQGRLEAAPSEQRRLVFHDPCYLGRYNGIYQQPRKIVRSIAGLHLVEMERSRSKSFCCGGGGGRMWLEETLGREKINQARTRQALALDPDIIAVCCPFCTTMFEDGLKARDLDEKVRVYDVAELLARAVEPRQ